MESTWKDGKQMECADFFLLKPKHAPLSKNTRNALPDCAMSALSGRILWICAKQFATKH